MVALKLILPLPAGGAVHVTVTEPRDVAELWVMVPPPLQLICFVLLGKLLKVPLRVLPEPQPLLQEASMRPLKLEVCDNTTEEARVGESKQCSVTQAVCVSWGCMLAGAWRLDKPFTSVRVSWNILCHRSATRLDLDGTSSDIRLACSSQSRGGSTTYTFSCCVTRYGHSINYLYRVQV